MATAFGSLQAENTRLSLENQQLRRDMDQLNDNMVTLVKEFTKVKSSGKVSTTGTTSSRPKVAEPPKYKGNRASDITLEQWLQKIGLWFRHHNINQDAEKITTALMYLEGGAQSYMDDYIEKAAEGVELGSWEDFVGRLKSGYRQLAPEKSAQQSLEELCAKNHSSMAKFAEDFRRFASKSGYSDTELIRRVDNQCSRDIRGVMVTHWQISPATVPTRWENYLDWVLGIEMQFRDNLNNTQTHAHTTTTTRKDPNAMDIDAMRKPEKMSKEQLDWLSNKLCFRCGRHPFKAGTKCRNPKYTGFYELPATADKAKPLTSQARALTEGNTEEDKTKMEFLQRALEEFDRKQKGEPDKPIDTSRIARIDEEEDFLNRVL